MRSALTQNGLVSKLVLISLRNEWIIPLGGIRLVLLSVVTMLKSYPFRLAVNLCLVGALLLSPVGIGSTSAAPCQASASNAAKCTGCGTCSAARDGSCCGCCCKESRTTASKPSPTKSCCQKNSKTEESQSAILGVCLCGKSIPPAVPNSQYRIDVEQVLKLAQALGTTLPTSVEDTLDCLATSWSPPTSLPPRTSQRLLCIWLI